MSRDYAGVRRVAVIGAGTIGSSWAAYFLSRGLEVIASDPKPESESFLRRYITAAWPSLERLGLAAGASVERLGFVRDPMTAIEGADFVQENIPEREKLKIDLFEQLGSALPIKVLIASSSSGLPISRLQSRCRFPERCVLAHPFNPPHIIPLVEVAGGVLTSRAAVARAMAFYRAIGKRPIHLRKEVKGHVANRLQSALWREAVHLLAEGVASVADIDTAISHGPGLRWAIMGPYLTFHLAGGEGGMRQFMHHFGGGAKLWSQLGSPVLTPKLQRSIIQGVAEETGERPISQLAKERDASLIAIYEALGRNSGRPDETSIKG